MARQKHQTKWREVALGEMLDFGGGKKIAGKYNGSGEQFVYFEDGSGVRVTASYTEGCPTCGGENDLRFAVADLVAYRPDMEAQ